MAQKKQFRTKYELGRDCALGRIEEMASYSSATPSEIAKRKKHVLPIQAAYTYAKDCLRKYGKREKITEFTNTINSKINKVAETRPNITTAQVFGDRGIEQSILHPQLRYILNKPYYSPDDWNIIFNGRNIESKGPNYSDFTNNEYRTMMRNLNDYNRKKTRKHGSGRRSTRKRTTT